MVTFTASTFEFVICLVTGLACATSTPTLVTDELLSMPGIFVWFDVPNRGSKDTS